MSDERRDAGDAIRDGVRSISGILGALKDALEETFEDLRKSGELSPERAREAAKSTFRKAQEALEDVRGRIEPVSRREFDNLRREVEELRARVDALEKSAQAGATQATAPGGMGGGATSGNTSAAGNEPATGATEATGEQERAQGESGRADPRYRFDVE